MIFPEMALYKEFHPPLLREGFAKRGSRGKSYQCKIMKITKITERFLCLKMIQMIPI